MAHDKTKTIKKRRVEVYLPTIETRDNWKAQAKERGMTLSDFVFQTVETALDQRPETVAADLLELQEQLDDQQHELDSLTRRNNELNELKDRLEGALSKYRARDFLYAEPVKQIDNRLVKVISEARHRNGKPRLVSDAELRKRLQVDADDIESLKGITAQLEFLERHGMVARRKDGWAWND